MAQKRKIIVSIMLAVVLAVLGGVMAACGGTKSFTVTFDSNGGSAVEAVKVKDGKFVEKPADPTRENYNFLGWMDEENNAFAFESTKITKDITLKASWALKTYTVTFNTNGGTSISSETVEHGSTVQKPEDPTKPGEVFLGWYEDSAFKTPYNFDTAITEAKTIYARFAAEVEEVYTARLMDGEVELDPVQTNAAGMLVNLPNGSGENFIGWWISDSQDAEKLTCQYVDQVLTQNMTLYAVYEGAGVAVSVNATGVSWTSKGTNRSYTVTITPPEGDPISNTGSTLNFPYNFANQPAGEYRVEVTFNGVTTTVYYNNKALSRVSLFEVEGFVLTFNKVANATNYSLAIDCGHSEHVNDVHDLGNNNTYDFTSCEMKEDGIKFVVTASADGYMSSVSEEYVVLRTLDAATNFGVEPLTEEVTWDAVEGAERYYVQINDEEGYVVTETKTHTLKNYDVGDIVVKVTAMAQGYNNSEVATYTYGKTSLLVPQNVKVLDTIVTWDAVNGAVSYVVMVNGVEHPVNGTSFTVPADTDITSDVYISVKAVSENGANDSLYSEEKKLTTTLEGQVSYSNGKVRWNNVFGITKYAVRVNGGQETVVEGVNELAITFNGRGTNTVSVSFYNKDDVQSEWESIDVQVYTVALMYNNVQNNTQYMSFYRAVGDDLNIPNTKPSLAGYEFKFWSADSNSEGVEFTGLTLDKAADLTLYAQWATASVAVLLDADGGKVEEASMGIRYLESFNLPIPTENEDAALGFEGWYTGRNGDGERLTDASGNSVKPWPYNQPMTIYANWVTVLKFNLVNNNKNYEVVAGPNISKVTNVTVPAVYNSLKVTNLGADAFGRCSKLKVINIPDSLEFIEFGLGGTSVGSAFTGCVGLEAVNVYDASTQLKEQYEKKFASYEGVLFYKNEFTGIELKYYPESRRGDYEIPYGTQIIPFNVLSGYKNIAKITVPASVTNIYESFNNSSITELVFLEKPEQPVDLLGLMSEDDLNKEPAVVLETNAFYNCYDLKTVTFPTHLKNFSAKAFGFPQSPSRTIMFESVSINDGPSDYSVVDGMLTTADKSEIVFCPFGRTGVVDIPSGVNTIGEYAFQNCIYIVGLNVPGWVREIKKAAFYYCKNLTTVNFMGKEGDEDLYIREDAFFYCNNVSGATVPGGGGIKKVTLSPNIVYVGARAFGGITGLSEVTLNTVGREVVFEKDAFTKGVGGVCSVYYINIGPKAYVEGIADVFGTMVKTINLDPANPYYEMGSVDKDTGNGVDNDVLYNVGKTAIIFVPMAKEGVYFVPTTVDRIAAKTFLNRSKITRVIITHNVATIGDSAFQGCYMLSGLSFLKDLSGSGDDGGRAAEVDLTIGAHAFDGCGIATPMLPARIVSIGDYAFANCLSLNNIRFLEGSKCTRIGVGAFDNCPSLVAVEFPAAVEIIGSSAQDKIDIFKDSRNVETLSFLGTSTKFAVIDNILYGLDKDGNPSKLLFCPLSNKVENGKIVVPSTVIKICANAFENNLSLIEIDFSQLINPCEFGANVFTGCKGIKNIVLPQGITTIGSEMFSDCFALEYVFVPNTVTVIEKSAFSNCLALETIEFEDGGEDPLTLPESPKMRFNEMGEISDVFNAFEGCISIKELNFPARLEVIPGGAFANLTATKVTFGTKLPDGSIADDSRLTSIGGAAFYRSLIEEIVLPASLQEFALHGDPKDPKAGSIAHHFYGCSKLRTVTFATSANGGMSTIPSIPDSAFYGCSVLTEITLPSTVTQIAKSAFELSGLTNIDMSACTGLESIGDYAFKSASLTSITIPASVRTVGEEAFAYNFDLATITFGDNGNLETLGKGAFKFANITKFTFPMSSSNIALSQDIFYGCARLNEVVLNNKVVSGIEGAFNGTAVTNFVMNGNNASYVIDTVLDGAVTDSNGKNVYYYYRYTANGVSVEISDTATAISPYAFAGKNITEIRIPASVVTIGEFAFSKCVNLVKVIFVGDSSALQSIGEGAFNGCTKLVSVLVEEGGGLSAVNTFPNKNLQLGTYLFNGCTALTSFTIPSAQSVVPSYMFRCCDSMTSVEILSAAGYSEGMFQGAMFESFTLTKPSIPAYMFDGCTNLKTIVGNYTIVGSYAFRNTGFTSIDLSSVSSLGSYAFYGCKDLVTATIKNPSQYIFAECSSLQTVYLNGTTSIGNYAFYNCTALKEVNVPPKAPSTEREGEVVGTRIVSTLPAAITSVGQYAFANTAIEEIILSSSMNSVAAYTFNGCANLVRIELSDMVTTIAEYAFQNCVNLSIVTYTGYAGDKTFALPANCTLNRAYYTFYNTAITEAYYNTGTTSGQYTFAECKNLKYAEMLGGRYTGTGTFMNCTALETIILPDNLYVTAISGSPRYTTLNSFFAYNCSSLTSIDIGNVNNFDSACFYGCTSLEQFTIPENTVYIADFAFAFTGLRQVMIPASIDGQKLINNNTKFLKQSAFYGCDNLTMIACAENNPVFRSIDGVLYLKEHEIVWIYPAGKEGAVAYYEENELFNQLDTAPRVAATTVGGGNASGSQAGQPVYIIAQSFSGKQFTNIVVPEGIQTIKGTLFSTGGNNYAGTFGYMTYLKSITLPSTLRTIEPWAFAYCTALESIVIPEGITEIPGNAFKGCTSLKSVTLPSTLEVIGYSAFEGCTSLDTINLPESLLELGNRAFAKTAIKSFTLPKNMTTLGFMNGNLLMLDEPMGLFADCTQLTEVILHDKLTALGGGIFTGCTNLKSLELPASLTQIGEGVFNGTGITEATIPATMTKGNEIWQRAFAGNTTITKVTIPEGIYKIPAYTFDGCTALTTVVLPSTLRVIGEGAFRGCTSLTSLFPNGVTPANIKLIERYAFEGCTAMTNIYIASNTVLGVGVFKGWTNKQTVNFVDDEIKVNALTIIEGWWQCSNTYCHGTVFIEQKGELMCQACGNMQREYVGDSNYDSYKTGCAAKLVYSAKLPESNER